MLLWANDCKILFSDKIIRNVMRMFCAFEMWKVGQACGQGLDAQKRLLACNLLMSFTPRDIFNAKFLDQESISQTYLLLCVLTLLCIMRRFCAKLLGAGCTEKVTCLPCYNEFRSSRQVCAMWWREEEIGQLKQLHKLHFLSQQHLNNPTTLHEIKSHIQLEILTC